MLLFSSSFEFYVTLLPIPPNLFRSSISNFRRSQSISQRYDDALLRFCVTKCGEFGERWWSTIFVWYIYRFSPYSRNIFSLLYLQSFIKLLRDIVVDSKIITSCAFLCFLKILQDHHFMDILQTWTSKWRSWVGKFDVFDAFSLH